MSRVLVMVEGQTEERFVKDTLVPLLAPRDLYPIPTLLTTKKIKNGPNFKGGVTSFAKFEKDIRLLLQGAGGALVTTLIDYYGLPDDFPGIASRPAGSPVERVEHLERAVKDHFGNPKHFLPFFALHEFEAWLFSADDVLPKVMTSPEKQPEFAAIRSQVASPEDINENRNTAPSKRILQLFPGYRKALHGPMAIQRIGLEKVRAECAHLNGWISRLEAFAAA